MPPEDDQTPTVGAKIAAMYADALSVDATIQLARDIDEAIKDAVMTEINNREWPFPD